jgi:hypothetical protein
MYCGIFKENKDNAKKDLKYSWEIRHGKGGIDIIAHFGDDYKTAGIVTLSSAMYIYNTNGMIVNVSDLDWLRYYQ